MHIHPVSQRRIFFFLVVALLLSSERAASRQVRTIDIQASSGSRLETAPGKLLTLSFKITNTSRSRKRLESVITVPAGWRRLARDIPFEIEGGVSDIRLMSVSIPSETPAGEYSLRYAVRDAANPSDAVEVAMRIVVAAVTEQGLKLIDAPRLAVAGDSYKASFLLTNKGNVASIVRLNAISSNGFAAVPDSTSLHLAPGETRSVSVVVKTDVNLSLKVQDILELAVERDGKTQSNVKSYVEIVPRVTGTEDRYVRFPMLATLRFAGEGERKGAQLDLAGGGSLSESNEDRLFFVIRTPDIQQKSTLGRRDEYQVGYSTKQYELFFGDKNYSLSPLTEFNRYGFGASGDVRFSSVDAGGFYNETRFLSPKQREFAGYVTVRPYQSIDVGLNYLHKVDKQLSDIVTARGIFQPFPTDEIDVEYGIGKSGSRQADAYAARWSGRSTWYSYDARYVRSGSDYPGYFRDVDLKNLSLNFSPVNELRIEGYYRDERRNLGRDTTLLLAPRDRYYQAGIGYSNFFAVYFRTNDQDDLFPTPRFGRRYEVWQLRAGFGLPRFLVIGNVDLGTLKDRIAGTENPSKRYSLFASLQPFDGHTYGFTAEYAEERDPTTLTDQYRLSGSFTASVVLGGSTSLAFSLFGSRSRGEFEQTYALSDLSFEHKFSFGHTLTLRGRQSLFTPSIEGKEIAYLLEYSIPVGIPIARSKESGQLVGRVVDAEKNLPVPNVLLYAGGATAVTDRDGEFSFPALKPEKYVLQVDMASVGLNRVALQHLPQEITIGGGRETRFDISLTRSISVQGTVLLYTAQEQSAADTSAPLLKEPVGHQGVVLELSNAEDLHRRLTDSRGRFTFTGIRPGRWTLKILDGNLPDNTYFEKESQEIAVGPGGSADVTFKALPRRRRVRIISQGPALVAPPQKEKVQLPAVKVQPPDAEKPKVSDAPSAKIDTLAAVLPAFKPVVKAETLAVAPTKPKPLMQSEPSTNAPSKVGAGSGVERKRTPTSEISTKVIFVPRWLRFSIQLSTWPTREMADSAASFAVGTSGMSYWVGSGGTKDNRPTYDAFIGMFTTRKLAEMEESRIRKKVLPQSK